MELFLDVLGESLVDTAKMLPFLFLAYLLIGARFRARCWAVCRSVAFRPLRPTSTPPASSRWAP